MNQDCFRGYACTDPERFAAASRAMRVHANFAEYVPLALILVAFAELQGQPAAFVHGLDRNA